MELKKLVSQFAYRIEQKPDGGFIARASDPSIPPLEAPTREELLKTIQQKVVADLSAEFPDLKLALDGTQHQFAFHVERNSGGGFSIHSADPNKDVVHAATEQDLQTHVLEKILNAAGKSVLPQLAQAIAAQGNLGNVNVLVKKTSFKMNSGKAASSLGAGQSTAMKTPAPDGTSFTNSSNVLLDGSPITPEPSNFGKVFRLVPVFLLLAALIYFLLHRA
ncbi:MAG: hypothetical protein ACM3WP_10315 [Acidobacteriota bacterium]